MSKKSQDKGGAAGQAGKLFRVLLKTPRQRDIARRNAEISSQGRRECEKGSSKMHVYETLSRIYGLSVNHIGSICREGVNYV